MKIPIFSLHAYKIAYLCDMIRSCTKLDSVQIEDSNEKFLNRKCKHTHCSKYSCWNKNSSDYICDGEYCEYDDFISTDLKIIYNVRENDKKNICDEIEYILNDEKIFDDDYDTDSDMDENFELYSDYGKNKIIHTNMHGVNYYKYHQNKIFERICPKHTIRTYLRTFLDFDKCQNELISNRPIIISSDYKYPNDDHRGIDHCKLKLDFHQTYKLNSPVYYKDLVEAMYRVRSFKFSDKNYELYMRTYIIKDKIDILHIRINYDYGS